MTATAGTPVNPDPRTGPAPELPYTLKALDPAQITGPNVRSLPEPDPQLLDSIRDNWVRSPIGVLQTGDGQYAFRFGGRRLRACIQLGLKVPALVVDGTTGTPPTEIDRIFEPLDENDNRRPLDAADDTVAVQELLDLGVTVKVVGRRTGLKKDEVAAARQVAASGAARAAGAQYDLDLIQSAAVAEVAGDEKARTQLEAAQQGPGTFGHVMQRLRDNRADRDLAAAHAAQLAERGITVTDQGLGWDRRLDELADPAGNRLTPETHAARPGNVVFLNVYGREPDKTVHESWYCTDPKAHGHRKYKASTGHDGKGQSTEEATAERRQVLDSNKAWRSAETVRRRWLTQFLARPKVPDGGLQLILETFAAAPRELRTAMDYGPGGRHATAREPLAGWGYPLSEIEQRLVAAVRERQAKVAAVTQQDTAPGSSSSNTSEVDEHFHIIVSSGETTGPRTKEQVQVVLARAGIAIEPGGPVADTLAGDPAFALILQTRGWTAVTVCDRDRDCDCRDVCDATARSAARSYQAAWS